MDVWEGVEANHLMGRNGGRNKNMERRDEIVELRIQVASLMDVVQHLQHPHKAINESEYSHSHFENPLYGKK